MDNGEMGIILAIVGVGLSIIGVLGNNRLNKLSVEINHRFNKLSTRIEGVEIRLQGELSNINSKIAILREKNALKIDKLHNDLDSRINDLEKLIFSSDISAIAKEGESSDDEYARRARPKPPKGN